MRSDNRECRVFESKFERSIGDIITIDGTKFKVCSLHETKFEAMAFIGTFGWEHCRSFFDYNNITAS